MEDQTPLQASSSPSTNEAPQLFRPVSKVPTGLGAELLKIVVLGASYAGLAVAHRFLDDTINHLHISSESPNYRLVIVNPSTHFYWNIAAPRALVRPDLLEDDNLFTPIEDGLHKHRAHNLSLIQGEAIAIDPSARTVTVEVIGSTVQKRMSQISKRASGVCTAPQGIQTPRIQTIAYHALIIATGTSAQNDMFSLHGPHLSTLGALNAFHARLAIAKSIIMSGGGCSGVETAGQLATYLNHRSHCLFKKRTKNAKKIILITGNASCLPDLHPASGRDAEKILRKLGVKVRHNVRVVAAKQDFDLTGATKVELSDDTFLIGDVYISCTGLEPNTAFVPASMKDGKDYIIAHRSTLRCNEANAGPRVYTIGDCASNSRNCLQDVYAALPVLMQNLLNDLLAHECRIASPNGENRGKIDKLKDSHYRPAKLKTVLCPIDRHGGVGVWKGWAVSGLLVHALKGHDYRVKKSMTVVEYGQDPYH